MYYSHLYKTNYAKLGDILCGAGYFEIQTFAVACEIHRLSCCYSYQNTTQKVVSCKPQVAINMLV